MITTDWNGGVKVDESIVEDIKKIADIKALKDHPNLLVFPYSFGEYDEGFGKNSICTFDEEEQKVHTRNILGFVGINKTQLTIRSRFTKNIDAVNNEDYFLHYMLQKVFGVHVFDMKHTTSKDNIFDFSLYMFPHFLKKVFLS